MRGTEASGTPAVVFVAFKVKVCCCPKVLLGCRRLPDFDLICGQSGSFVMNQILVSVTSGCSIKLKKHDR